MSYGQIERGRGIKSVTAREATPSELLALLDAVQLSEDDAGLAVSKPQRRSARGKSDAAPVTRPGRSRRSPRDDDEDDGFESNKRRAKRGKSQIPRLPVPARTMRAESRSAEHTSELQSLMRISYAVVCLKTKPFKSTHKTTHSNHTNVIYTISIPKT